MERVEISREVYESLRDTKAVKVEMEAKYYLITNGSGKASTKRKPNSRRRSPTALIRATDKALQVAVTDNLFRARQAALTALGESKVGMSSSNLARYVAEKMEVSKDMGSYYVGKLIKRGALEIV